MASLLCINLLLLTTLTWIYNEPVPPWKMTTVNALKKRSNDDWRKQILVTLIKQHYILLFKSNFICWACMLFNLLVVVRTCGLLDWSSCNNGRSNFNTNVNINQHEYRLMTFISFLSPWNNHMSCLCFLLTKHVSSKDQSSHRTSYFYFYIQYVCINNTYIKHSIHKIHLVNIIFLFYLI